jgi:hypothetical protein
MSKSDLTEAGFIDLFFLNQAFADVGDASGLQPSSTAGSFYISLHTADPTDSGDQTSNEADYTSYARVAVARSGAGWSRSGNEITNAAAVDFPEATGGDNDITHFGIGSDASGAGNLWYAGALTATLSVTNLITPSFAIGELSVTED